MAEADKISIGEIRRTIEITRTDFAYEKSLQYRASVIDRDFNGTERNGMTNPYTDVRAIPFEKDMAYVLMTYAFKQSPVAVSAAIASPVGVMPMDADERDVRKRLHDIAKSIGEEFAKKYNVRELIDKTDFAEQPLPRGGK